MADILKEMIKCLPSGKICDSAFEGANIVLYTKDKDFFLDNGGAVRQLVETFKKRVELRPDPSITLDPEKAEIIIRQTLPEESGVTDVFFDEKRSKVIIHADKPGTAIGKQGSLLQDIKAQTMWVPTIRRTAAIRSKLIENIRAVLYQCSDERRKFLDRVGHRIYDGWIRDKKNEWIRLTYLGGAREVGRSCILLQTPESRVLLDCGVNPASEQYAFPYLESPDFDLNQLDAIILSHSHIDHSGLIPYLFKMGYRGPVYCTAPTRDVSVLLQLDFVKIQHFDNKELLYDADDVKEMVKNTICLDYEEVTDITPDIRITFYNAGHILGSAMVHLHIGNGMHNLVYSGDLKVNNSILLNGANNRFPRLETLMLESTYGGKENVLPPGREAEQMLKNVILETLKRGGKVLMPVLGSGRAQELMVMLEQMVREKEMESIPVYIDGLVWDITAIHTAYPEFMSHNIRNQIFHKDNNPFLSPMFKHIAGAKERSQVIDYGGPCVILATSGMLTGGPSVQYLRSLAEDVRNSLIFSCFQAEGSLGKRIQRGEREIAFAEGQRQDILQIKMEVHKALEISGHADRRELINYVSKVRPTPKKIIVNHGEASRCLDLASSIHKHLKIETAAPRDLEAVRIR